MPKPAKQYLHILMLCLAGLGCLLLCHSCASPEGGEYTGLPVVAGDSLIHIDTENLPEQGVLLRDYYGAIGNDTLYLRLSLVPDYPEHYFITGWAITDSAQAFLHVQGEALSQTEFLLNLSNEHNELVFRLTVDYMSGQMLEGKYQATPDSSRKSFAFFMLDRKRRPEFNTAISQFLGQQLRRVRHRQVLLIGIHQSLNDFKLIFDVFRKKDNVSYINAIYIAEADSTKPVHCIYLPPGDAIFSGAESEIYDKLKKRVYLKDLNYDGFMDIWFLTRSGKQRDEYLVALYHKETGLFYLMPTLINPHQDAGSGQFSAYRELDDFNGRHLYLKYQCVGGDIFPIEAEVAEREDAQIRKTRHKRKGYIWE
jgi:hypothetical protein